MYSLPWIRLLFHRLHGAQQKTLAFFVDALLAAQNVCLAELAREAACQSEGRMQCALKRLWRFLRNANFRDEVITQGLAQWLWPRFHSWKHIPISLDWTHNEKHDHWATLAASVTLQGRGIPLMTWSFRKADYEEHLSRNRCEEAFIKHLMRLLPDDPRIVLVADRGFARVSLFQWLTQHGVHFIVRVPRHAHVRSDHYQGPLADLRVANGECYSLGETQYTDKDAWVAPQLVVAREKQDPCDPDPWFLVTSLSARPTTLSKLYARRMIIEEDFREAKARLDWSNSRIRKPEHYRRLTTLITVVLAFATLVGRVAQRRPTLAAQVARRRKGRWDHGCTALGLALLRRTLQHLRLLHQVKLPAQPI